jgi:methyl-accepting chemotaxis protein
MMAERANMINKIFKRTDLKISVLISCSLAVIIFICVQFLAGVNNQAISDAIYEKGKMASMLGAKSIEIAFEDAIDNNFLTQEEVFDSQYVPVAGSEPQLFHTKFDAYMDETCSEFHETYFKDSSVVYARPMDLNGYAPLQGNGDTSNKNNLKSAVDPLAKQILAGKRISLAVANTVDGFVQNYISEYNDEEVWEFSTPVYVNGERWGSFSVGYRNLSKEGLGGVASVTTIILAVSSILLACVVVFSVVFFFLKPISGLSEVAEQVADGDVDRSVLIGGSNDMATLADAIERLRVSLKLSMDRMEKK